MLCNVSTINEVNCVVLTIFFFGKHCLLCPLLVGLLFPLPQLQRMGEPLSCHTYHILKMYSLVKINTKRSHFQYIWRTFHIFPFQRNYPKCCNIGKNKNNFQFMIIIIPLQYDLQKQGSSASKHRQPKWTIITSPEYQPWLNPMLIVSSMNS